jgi:hypothetical protein
VKENSKRDSKTQKRKAATVFSIQLMGVNPSMKSRGLEKLAIKTNYLIGNDPRAWRQDIPTYAKVEFKELYAGIDLVYYGNQRQLEFDFLVHPGADHKSIRMKFKNVNHLNLDRDGNLIVSVAGGKILLEKPLIYQQVDGKKRTVSGHYKLQSKNIVGFHVAAYDSKIPLVIDPVLNYSTYLGGASDDFGNGIDVDAFGNSYIVGSTRSNDFPTENPLQPTRENLDDVFISKFNSDGTALVYSTYLGGNSEDIGNSIKVDSSGNAYITGSTQSTNFPTQSPFQAARASLVDAFVTKLNSDGSALVYSTYLGGDADDWGNGIALDSSNNAYIVGTTRSSNGFPILNALDNTLGGTQDAFVTKLDPSLAGAASLIYSTYLGGDADDWGNGIALDSSNNAYIVGTTRSSNGFPILNAFQATPGSVQDAFITKLDPSLAGAASLIYSTYFGGNNNDFGNGIAVDSSGNVYVTGATLSTNFPLQNPIQASSASLEDAFIAELTSDGSALVYSTYLGGDARDFGNSIAVDTSGNAYITGSTGSKDFPTEDAFQPNRGSLRDAFVAKINPSGEAILYSTYIGGSADDFGGSIAVDSAGNAYVVGTTESADFPTPIPNPFQGSNAGQKDVFVSKFNPFGDTFLYSTYLGGSGNDFGNGIAVDAFGNAYVTGTTLSNDFPMQDALQPIPGGNSDVFITKLNSTGTTPLIYSTYLGGSADDLGNDIAVDSSGAAYVTGETQSANFPTQSPIQAGNAGSSDAFVTKLKADNSDWDYSTYLGGTGDDLGNGIAVDSSGNAYVAGTTDSNDFPTQGPIQAANAGSNDAFVTKFNSAGSALTYSTYLGGSMDDFGNSIAVDISGNAYVTGTTVSDNFPTESAFQANRGGLQDSFVTKVNAAGDTLVYSSYLGGSNVDLGNAIAVDGLGNAFVAGTTDSTNFPTKSVQDNLRGGNDGFVAKVQEAEVTDSSAGGGNEATGGGGGASCFIATAANGSSMAWQVQLLSVIFILLALLCTTLFVLFRRLKLREVVFKTARLKSK